MEAIRMQKAVEKDGEIFLTGLPYKKGQFIEMIFLSDGSTTLNRSCLTARQLLNSDLIGLWEDRDDIEDSSAFAREFREET